MKKTKKKQPRYNARPKFPETIYLTWNMRGQNWYMWQQPTDALAQQVRDNHPNEVEPLRIGIYKFSRPTRGRLVAKYSK